jgi:N-methylhydantoinase B
MSAQLSALGLGSRRLTEIIARHGLDAVLAVVSELQRRSEEEARTRFRELSGQRARAEDILDNDGITDEPLTIVCELEFRDDGLVLDFTKSSDQGGGPVNLPEPGTVSSCQIAVKHWWPEIPINAGCFRALTVRTRRGSVLAAPFPAAVSGYSDVMQRVIDVVLRCLGTVMPERAIGSAFGTTGALSITWRTETGIGLAAWYIDGGYGATSELDGLVGGSPLHSTSDLPPVEVFEHRAPVRFVERALRPDSGGAGTHRGGCGSVHELEFTAPATVAFIGDRTQRGPSGVIGGHEGGKARWTFTLGGVEQTVPLHGKGVIPVAAGDRLRILTPGGGGWGDPAGRSPEAHAADLRDGYVGAGEDAPG